MKMGFCEPTVCLILTTILLSTTTFQAWGANEDKMPLKNVDAITLRANKMTTGRRSRPIPQLVYKGTSSLSQYTPSTVQCYNRGHDGYDIQWECVAELAGEVKFGDINVQCEGYEFPDDPNILRGSCGLEYTLEHTGVGGQNSKNAITNQHVIYKGKPFLSSPHQGSFQVAIVFLCIGVFLCLVCIRCRCCKPKSYGERHTTSQNRPYPDAPPPYPGTEPSAPEPPPAYGWVGDNIPDIENEKTYSTSQLHAATGGSTQSQTATGGPTQSQTIPQSNSHSSDHSGTSFWGRGTMRGIGDFLFGNRGRAYYNSGPGSGGFGSGWGSNWGSPQHIHVHHTGGANSWFGSGGSNSSSSNSSWFGGGASGGGGASVSSHKSSGFGGTSRR